jgi:hypothetical protein
MGTSLIHLPHHLPITIGDSPKVRGIFIQFAYPLPITIGDSPKVRGIFIFKLRRSFI